MPRPDWSQTELSDRPEMMDNKLHTVSMKLFELIKTELDTSGFTLEDVTGNFNFGSIPSASDQKVIRYGKSHLDYLVKQDLLEYDERSKEYYVVRDNDFFKDNRPDEVSGYERLGNYYDGFDQ